MFCSVRRSVSFVFLVLLGFAGCRKSTPGPPPRYAIVRFENLSGDPSLDWVGPAASEYLSYALAHAMNGPVLNPETLARRAAVLGNEPLDAPGSSAQRSDALTAGATRLISGYLEKIGNDIRVTATEEDLVTHRTLRIVNAAEPDAMKAMAQLAHEISPAASPYLTSNGDVLRLYVSAMRKPVAEAAPELEQAIGKDPDYGPAWMALANVDTVLRDQAAALDAIAKASARRLDPLDRAGLDLVAANIAGDRDRRVEALGRVAALNPADAGLMRTLAELEMTAGRFADAAREWGKLAGISPNDFDALNQMGYARAWSGDYSGALAAIKQYAQVRPSDPNPLDSAGDVEYMYRRFPEAAADYLQAEKKSPQFQNGGELYKAAWAQFKAGDKAKADKSFQEFRAAREKAGVKDFDLFEADWLYRTGRRSGAMALLRREPRPAAAAAQLAIWDLLAGDRAAAVRDFSGVPPTASAPVLIARFVSLPSADAREWEQRADRMIQGNGAEAVRRLALAYALILDSGNDGDREAATAEMEKVVAQGPATDFFAHAVLAKLKGEKTKLELLPDPATVNQMRALAD